MKKKLLLVVGWVGGISVCLIVSLYLLLTSSSTPVAAQPLRKELTRNYGYQFYAALPEVLGEYNSQAAAEDARPEITSRFLKTHDSPLAPYAQLIVTASDMFDLDFRLITAISMCESNVGKKMPTGSFNAWGYQIYTGQDNGATFTNWHEAIVVMAEYLSSRYYSQGLTTPEDIGPIYAPPSVETGNSWAKCVRRFMDELS